MWLHYGHDDVLAMHTPHISAIVVFINVCRKHTLWL